MSHGDSNYSSSTQHSVFTDFVHCKNKGHVHTGFCDNIGQRGDRQVRTDEMSPIPGTFDNN
jgi:hypothetical protein